ncbi:nucleotidyltransferase family protein [Gemmata palustris]|nr:nucleotidyltransferase family protein [Gemmata palustris]
MIQAVEDVRERCELAARTLEAAGIPYAVVGGHAVANWIASIDRGSVRNTRDVDILVRRDDLEHIKAALDSVGFDYAEVTGIHLFVKRPDGKPSEGIHIIFAGERVFPNDPVPAPEVNESARSAAFQVLELEPLVRMKLVAFRRKDQVHLQDMVRLGLLDATWPGRFPEPLAERLREILADPDG